MRIEVVHGLDRELHPVIAARSLDDCLSAVWGPIRPTVGSDFMPTGTPATVATRIFQSRSLQRSQAACLRL